MRSAPRSSALRVHGLCQPGVSRSRPPALAGASARSRSAGVGPLDGLAAPVPRLDVDALDDGHRPRCTPATHRRAGTIVSHRARRGSTAAAGVAARTRTPRRRPARPACTSTRPSAASAADVDRRRHRPGGLHRMRSAKSASIRNSIGSRWPRGQVADDDVLAHALPDVAVAQDQDRAVPRPVAGPGAGEEGGREGLDRVPRRAARARSPLTRRPARTGSGCRGSRGRAARRGGCPRSHRRCRTPGPRRGSRCSHAGCSAIARRSREPRSHRRHLVADP